MARRRMFSLELTSSDKFLSLTPAAQSLYFHLGIHADDEGFVSAPNSLARLCGGGREDLAALERTGFTIVFDSGVLVITDWLLNNTIRKDRSTPTIHRVEKEQLALLDGRYVLRSELTPQQQETAEMATNLSTNLATQNRIEENRIEENRIDKNRIDNNREEYGTVPAQPSVEVTVSRVLDYAGQRGIDIGDALRFWVEFKQTAPDISIWRTAMDDWIAREKRTIPQDDPPYPY